MDEFEVNEQEVMDGNPQPEQPVAQDQPVTQDQPAAQPEQAEAQDQPATKPQQPAAKPPVPKTGKKAKKVKKAKGGKPIWWKNVLAALWIVIAPVIHGFLVRVLIVIFVVTAILVNPDGTNGVTCDAFTFVMEDLKLDTLLFSDLSEYVATTDNTAGEQGTYTLMVYLLGANLESQNGAATRDILEMLEANLTPGVRIILYTGGCYYWQNNLISAKTNQYYLIDENGIQFLKEEKRQNMADPTLLTNFIRYSMENFPADHTALILWDHGDGPVMGFGATENTEDEDIFMEVPELDQALSDALGDQKLDFIGFDACLMGSIEVLDVLSDYTDWMVASPETTNEVGFSYTNSLNVLSENPDRPTYEICKSIADEYVAGVSEANATAGTLSVLWPEDALLCVYDLTQVDALVDTLNDLAEKLMVDDTPEYLVALGAQMRNYGQSSFDQIDLGMWANCFAQDYPDTVATFQDQLAKVVKYKNYSDDVGYSSGLAAYYPNSYASMSFVDGGSYETLYEFGYCNIDWGGSSYMALVDTCMRETYAQQNIDTDALYQEAEEQAITEVLNGLLETLGLPTLDEGTDSDTETETESETVSE